MLLPDQIATFRAQGFVHVPGLFDETDVRDFCAWSDELVALPEVPGRHMAYYEDSLSEPGKRVLSRIENFCPFHRPFDELLRAGRLLHCVEQMLGDSVVLFKEKINFKMPGADGFAAHQDAQAGWGDYAPYHVTALVSLDPTTVENGCLEIAPSPVGRALIGELWKPLEDADFAASQYVALPTQPGDVVVFDSFVPHRSAPNATDKPRRVLYVTYNLTHDGDHRVQYYADKRANYPPDCERQAGEQYEYRV
ncbi:MAG: phytanoyl-CoA dioxygenase family protein [Gammaproteobacteria bacterium]|nr:phytanoyl-CoA dioxygenase family protein [Gammaproteobacteria bacterium]